VGSLATRAYVPDADGVIWRIDLAGGDAESDDPESGWTARPFHDMYWQETGSDGYRKGEPSYDAPVLSVDEAERVVVLCGTGDTDDFNDTDAQNYVASLTEVDASTDGTPSVEDRKAAFNWQIVLQPSELMTGAPELFAGTMYFATFVVKPGTDPCALGNSRLFAVDYIDRDLSSAWNTTPITYAPKKVRSSDLCPNDNPACPESSYFNTADGVYVSALENVQFMGVGMTKLPQCFSEGDIFSTDVPLIGSLAGATPSGAAQYQMTAMVNIMNEGRVTAQSISVKTPEQVSDIGAYSGTCE